MKVLLVNGSPHKNGCTYTALKEIADELKKNDIDSEISEPMPSVLAWLVMLAGNSVSV